MSPISDVPTSATARQLLLVAERMFAQYGITGVSLRQIALEAGSSNNSAIHYHFGSKDDLLHAIVRLRQPELLHRRELLKARSDPDDLRSQVEAYLLPLLELAEAPEGSYVSFVEQVQRNGPHELFTNEPAVVESYQDFQRTMQRLLKGVPAPLRTLRVRQVQSMGVHVAAERERAVGRDDARESFGLFVAAIVDGLTAFLDGPIAPETRRLVKREKPVDRPPGQLR